MGEVNVHELCNAAGHLLDRVAAGEQVTIARDGTAVAQLVPIGRPRLSAVTLVERFRRLPPVDADALRADIDAVIGPRL